MNGSWILLYSNHPPLNYCSQCEGFVYLFVMSVTSISKKFLENSMLKIELMPATNQKSISNKCLENSMLKTPAKNQNIVFNFNLIPSNISSHIIIHAYFKIQNSQSQANYNQPANAISTI